MDHLPAEPEFTFKWQRLVAEMVENGGNVAEAAETAGYTDVRGAYRALREAHVQEALIDGLRSRLARLGPAALQSLLSLSQSARSEKVRLDAATAVLDRLGIQAVDHGSAVRIGEVNINVDLSGQGGGAKIGVDRPSPPDPSEFSPETCGSQPVIDDAEIIKDGDDG